MTSRPRSKKALGSKPFNDDKLNSTISELENAITEWEVLESSPHIPQSESKKPQLGTPSAPADLILKLKEQLEAFD